MLSYSAIARGGIYVQHDWLEPALVRELRQEVGRLEMAGNFAPSGVATAGTDGNYGTSDRQVCVLSSDGPSLVERRLHDLALELRRTLDRPTLACAECYYSISSGGAARSKWPSWWGRGQPPRAPRAASAGVGPPSALGRRS